MLIGLNKEELPVIHVVWLYHAETSDIYGKNVSWYCGDRMCQRRLNVADDVPSGLLRTLALVEGKK